MSSPETPSTTGRDRYPAESSLFVRPDGTEDGVWASRIAVVLAAALLIATFLLAGGLAGILAAAVTLAVWYALGSPYAIATGVVTAGAVGVTTPTGSAVVGLGLLGVLLAPTAVAFDPGRSALATVLFTAGFGTVAVLLLQVWPLWVGAVGVSVALALVGYAVHRYQLVALGLVEPDETQSWTEAGGDSTDGGDSVDDDTETEDTDRR